MWIKIMTNNNNKIKKTIKTKYKKMLIILIKI